MKYFAETLKYMFKNLLYILPMGILPGLVYVGAFDYAHFKLVVTKFFTGKLLELEYLDLFRFFSPLNVSTWYGTLLSVFGFFVICIMVATLLALIEKHMRIGKRTLNGVFSKLNDNILTTIFVAFVGIAIYEIWTALTALALFSILKLFIRSVVAAYIFFIIVLALAVYLLVSILAKLVLWIPCQLITGFNVFESLTYSAHLSETRKRRLYLPLFLPVLIGTSILCLCVIGGTPALAPVVFFVYLFYVLFFCTLMEVAYFTDAEMEREDLKPVYKRRNL